MLLIDLSAAILHTTINLHKDCNDIESNLKSFRLAAFSTILYYKNKFSKEYGTPILCVDEPVYWRKSVFETYKGRRKKNRDKSDIDWEAYKENFNIMKDDFQKYLPYPFINVKRTEADDAIAVLTQYAYKMREKVLIVSSDKDLIQLQSKYKNVKQWSPRTSKYVLDDDYCLLTHIVKGDGSDDIPNILSDDDVFFDDNKRQKPITKKIIENIKSFDSPLESFSDDTIKKRYKRNQLLIDLDYTPNRLQDRILAKYEHELSLNKKNKMMVCVKQYRLRNLLDKVHQF